MSNDYDWQKHIDNKGFPYDGDIDNKEWLKDRKELFAENGNGWWWLQGTYGYEKNGRKKNDDKSNK